MSPHAKTRQFGLVPCSRDPTRGISSPSFLYALQTLHASIFLFLSVIMDMYKLFHQQKYNFCAAAIKTKDAMSGAEFANSLMMLLVNAERFEHDHRIESSSF
jgi:hypothetical protein